MSPLLWWRGHVHTSFGSLGRPLLCSWLLASRWAPGRRAGPSTSRRHSGQAVVGEKGPPSTHFSGCSVPYRAAGLQSCCVEGGPLSPWGPWTQGHTAHAQWMTSVPPDPSIRCDPYFLPLRALGAGGPAWASLSANYQCGNGFMVLRGPERAPHIWSINAESVIRMTYNPSQLSK